jgi:hypothetical protein
VSDSAAGVRSKASQALSDALGSASKTGDTVADATAAGYLGAAAASMSFQLETSLRNRAQLDDRASVRKQVRCRGGASGAAYQEGSMMTYKTA